MSTFAELAERLTEQALDDIRDGNDALPTLEAACAVLRVECGELPETEIDGLLPDEEKCTCPADLVARGGFRSTCPVHGV